MNHIFFYSDTDKRPRFVERPPRRLVTPKLEITKRVTGTWGLDVKFFDRFPKDFGVNTHFGSDEAVA